MIFRVSHAEAFRRWREDEDAELAPLLASLRGQDEPSEAMKAGTALHAALETAQEGERDVLEAEGYRFLIECQITLALPPVRELRASRAYGPITITGKVDVIEGKRIEDHKTAARFDPDWYLPGYQWRFYLDIFGADVFRWNVFEISRIDGDPGDPPTYSVYGFHRLEQVRYPGLHADCARLAAELHEFACEHMPEHRRAA